MPFPKGPDLFDCWGLTGIHWLPYLSLHVSNRTPAASDDSGGSEMPDTTAHDTRVADLHTRVIETILANWYAHGPSIEECMGEDVDEIEAWFNATLPLLAAQYGYETP